MKKMYSFKPLAIFMLGAGLTIVNPVYSAGEEAAETTETMAETESANLPTYAIDSVHSTLIFSVMHMGVGNFYGRFNNVAGTIVFDPEKAEQSQIDVTIDMNSIDTNNADRDKHVKSSDYLTVEEHPEATFKSSSIRRVGENTFQISGDLTFFGQTKPIMTTFVYHGTMQDKWGNTRVGAQAEFSIKRSEFGADGGIPAVGDEVKIIISIEAIQES